MRFACDHAVPVLSAAAPQDRATAAHNCAPHHAQREPEPLRAAREVARDVVQQGHHLHAREHYGEDVAVHEERRVERRRHAAHVYAAERQLRLAQQVLQARLPAREHDHCCHGAEAAEGEAEGELARGKDEEGQEDEEGEGEEDESARDKRGEVDKVGA